MSDQIQKSVPGTIRVVCSPAASGSGEMAALNPVSAETCVVRLEGPGRDSPSRTGRLIIRRANGIPQELRDRIAAEYAAGDRSPVLAARYGYHAGYIRKICSEAGVTVRADTIKRARIWTPADIEKVAQMLRAGKSGATIGEAMGCTRQVAIGRIHRRPALKAIGLHGKSGLNRATKSARTGIQVVTRRRPKAEPQHFPEPVIGDGVSLVDLKPQQCKYPSGDGPIVFCCKSRRVAGKPYCGAHLARAYQCREAA